MTYIQGVKKQELQQIKNNSPTVNYKLSSTSDTEETKEEEDVGGGGGGLGRFSSHYPCWQGGLGGWAGEIVGPSAQPY